MCYFLCQGKLTLESMKKIKDFEVTSMNPEDLRELLTETTATKLGKKNFNVLF